MTNVNTDGLPSGRSTPTTVLSARSPPAPCLSCLCCALLLLTRARALAVTSSYDAFCRGMWDKDDGEDNPEMEDQPVEIPPPPHPLSNRDNLLENPISVFSRDGRLLPSSCADARSSDDVIAF